MAALMGEEQMGGVEAGAGCPRTVLLHLGQTAQSRSSDLCLFSLSSPADGSQVS